MKLLILLVFVWAVIGLFDYLLGLPVNHFENALAALVGRALTDLIDSLTHDIRAWRKSRKSSRA